MRDLAVLAVAYCLGCVQTGYYLVRFLTGQDLRRVGSGGTGARNAGRVLGRKGFVLTLLGDAGKGALAVVFALWLHASPGAVAATLVAVAAGHVWPAQLRFSGGRGVAVGLGALAVYDPRLLGVLAAVALLGAVAGRGFQASGLLGFAALPFAACYFRLPGEVLAGIAGLSVIVLFAHRSHIARYLGRTPEGGRKADAHSGD
ncbi:MAG: glycerol-3-phosphate acyltransferase [bacterium]